MISNNRVSFVLLAIFILLCIVSHTKCDDGFDDTANSISSELDDATENPLGEGYENPYGELEEKDRPDTATLLQSWDEIDNFVKINDFDTSIVGFFDESTNSEDLETFKEIAMTDGHIFKFAYTTNKSVLEARKYEGSAILVFPPPKFINEKMERSKHRLPFKSIANKQQAVLNFAKSKSIPLAGEYTNKNSEFYDSSKKPIVSIFTSISHERNTKGYNYLANRVRKVAKKYEGKFIFALVNTDSFLHSMEADYGFETPSGKEVLAGIRDADMFYIMKEKFSVENLSAFVEKFKAGELEGKQKIPNEEDPHGHNDDNDSWDIRPVVSVNNDNVQEVVLDTSADVMIEFYAPWCGHCRALKPEYKKVAEYFHADDDVTIAAFDATAGTVPPQFDVQGYPTLFFVPANDKANPIPYNGPRSSEEIISFIKTHRSTSPHSDL